MPVPSERSDRRDASGVCGLVPGGPGQVGVRGHELIDCPVDRERFRFFDLVRLCLSEGGYRRLRKSIVLFRTLREAGPSFLTCFRDLLLFLLPLVVLELRIKRFEVSCKQLFILVTRERGKYDLDRPVGVRWIEKLVRPAACSAASASLVGVEREADFPVLVVPGSRDMAICHCSVCFVQAELSFRFLLQVESVEGYSAKA